MQNQALRNLIRERRSRLRFYLFHGIVIVVSVSFAVSELVRSVVMS